VNFTLTVAERARAMVAGPPAWSIRLRRIEDLVAAITAELVAVAAAEGALPEALPRVIEPKLAALNRLVEAHNEYFPVEANLPSDPRTRRVMHGGEPWQRMEFYSAAALLAAARARLSRG
jgi:hypothetical protein